MSFCAGRRASVLACVSTLILSGSAHAQLLGALSEGEEAEVGRRAAEEIEKGLVFLSDDLVTSYVSELGQAMVAESQRSSLAYTFKVVDSEEINAFALPGGYIYVNRGLIEAADEEAELAGVIGHEVGHVVARHGAEQVQRAAYANLGLRVLGSLFGNGTGAQVGNVAAEMATTGVFMKFGRDAEREADRLGAENVAAAGHDPNGMITFFEKLGRLRDGQSNAVERFFASHPDPTERVANIQDLVQSLGSAHQYSSSSPRFAQVKTHLETLPRPPSAAPEDPAKATSYDGSTASGTAATVDPVPVTYEGADQDYQIAARFAPVFRQALGSSPRYDYITAFDFDGDWQGDNNWENAEDERHALSATVYFNVSETPTHYYIHYAAFHPRDYKGGNVRGVVLSEVLREGAARHGDYDPTGLSQAAVLAHENDMEGALIVVEKAAGLFGSTRVVFVETLAHNQFLQYRVDRRLFGRGDAEGVQVEDEHPVLFIEPKGHGIEAYHGGDQIDDVEGFVTYRYTGNAEEPSGVGAQVGDEEVGYELVSMAETLWPFARDRHQGIYGGEFDYGSWSIQTTDGSGAVTSHEVSVGEVGSVLRGSVGGRNMARPPWGWYDQDEQDQRQGGWFLTPAETVKRHFGLGDEFSTTYQHHPVLGVFR
jgi:Zn-dependent protease with chaperone function